MEEKNEKQSFQQEPDETEKPGVGESGEKEQGEGLQRLQILGGKKNYPGHEVHRVTEALKLVGFPESSSDRRSYNRLSKTMSSLVLSISIDGDSTASLGSLIQQLTTPITKMGFLMFR